MKVYTDHAINGFTQRVVLCIVLQAYDEGLWALLSMYLLR